MAAELRDAFRGESAVLDDLLAVARGITSSAASPRPRTLTPAQIAALTRDVVKAFTGRGFGFRLIIGGSHYSGLSNQALLEVRTKEGRDFDANTVQLTQWLRAQLLARFRGFGRVPSVAEVAAEASKLVVNYVATVRVMGGGGDIFVPGLTRKYAEWKAAHGKGGKPVGVFNGRWLQALVRQGHAEFTHV